MTHKPLNTAVTKSGTGSRHLDCLNCTYTVLASCFACFAERGQHPKFTTSPINKKTRPLRNGAFLRGRVFLLHFPFLSYPCRPNGTGLKTVPTPFKVWVGDGSHRLNISRFLSISSRSFSLGPLASSGWPCSSWSFKVVFSFSNEASIILWIFANVCSSVGVE